jgi:hypothetical protein
LKSLTKTKEEFMENNSRLRFNPVTKEIEVEGSESFVKTYFNKLQAMISGSSEDTPVVKEKSIKAKAAPKKKAENKAKIAKVSRRKKGPKAVKTSPAKKVRKVTKKEPGKKKVTNIDAVVTLIQWSAEGISTAELKEKTGLAESQIWNIVNRAAKEGKIKKLKRGSYGRVDAAEINQVTKTE